MPRWHAVWLLFLNQRAATAFFASGPNARPLLATATARAGRLRCWTGETVANIEIPDVPMCTLYHAYADLERMTEWSPLLESVTVDPLSPNSSVWVMRVPGPLQGAARMLGYPGSVSWQAECDAPGPPLMTWTSVLDDSGGLAGVPSAGFVPEGSVQFEELSPDLSRMTLTLRYTLPEPTANWKVAIILNPVVQGVVRGRMVAGMKRFSKILRQEWGSQVPHDDSMKAHREA